jgi:hypothetical protein
MKTKTLFSLGKKRLIAMSLPFLICGSAMAQVSISNLNAYSQNFNSLPQSGTSNWADNSTITGWYAANGTSVATSITASAGASTTTGLKSYGSASATGDRALGGVNSNNGTHYYGVRLKNNTGSSINRFIISYTGELWAKPSGKKSATIKFYYRVSNSMTSVTSGTWTELTANQLTITTGGGGATTYDGNLASRRKTITFSTPALNLAAGTEVMFRWADATTNGVYTALDDITITPTNASLYYSKSTGVLASTSTWGTNTDGTGIAPLDFTNGTFVIANRTSTTLAQDWALTGTANALLSKGSLTVPSTYKLTGTIDMGANTTLTLSNTVLPTIGTVGTNSEVIYNSTSNQTLPAASYSLLTLSGSGTKLLSANTRVNDGLVFSGAKMEIGNYDLTLGSGATIAGISSTAFVGTNGTGSLVQEVANDDADVLFPVGTSAYMPISIKQSANGTVDNYKVKAIDSIYYSYTYNKPNGKAYKQKAVNLTWIVDEETAGGSDVALTAQWLGTKSLTGFDISQTRLSHYHGGAWDETAIGNAVLSNGFYSISRSGINSFSPFGVFSGVPAPLPVELINFSARRTGAAVICEWQTATEQNNNHFAVERSLNGKNFEQIAIVKGAGTTSQVTTYNFTDELAPAKLTYYRLRQTDFDGTSSFSNIIKVAEATAGHEYAVEIFPNPAANVRYLRSQSVINEKVTVTVLNMQGKVVDRIQADGSKLSAGLPLNLSGKPKGVYFITLQTSSHIVTLKAVQD